MTYKARNIIRFARELAVEPAAAPGRVRAVLSARIRRSGEGLLARSGIGGALYRRFRGKGVTAMFHEIHADPEAYLRTGCTPAQLRRVLTFLKADGRDFVTVSEALERLADPTSRPFALVTFDDGYRDNRDLALPVLEEFGAPMTLFVPTGMLQRNIYAWWLGLRHLLAHQETVEVEAMGRRFQCQDAPSRNAAMRAITSWIGTDQARADGLKDTFTKYRASIASLVDEVAFDERELQEFARHPLVTIGGHTTTHRFLAGLGEDEAMADIADNRSWLQALTGQPIEDFAYPYGSPGACGAREAGMVKQAGYRCGFSTRSGQLFADHLETPHLMPREDLGQAFQPEGQIRARIEGWHRALTVPGGGAVAGLI